MKILVFLSLLSTLSVYSWEKETSGSVTGANESSQLRYSCVKKAVDMTLYEFEDPSMPWILENKTFSVELTYQKQSIENFESDMGKGFKFLVYKSIQTPSGEIGLMFSIFKGDYNTSDIGASSSASYSSNSFELSYRLGCGKSIEIACRKLKA